MIAPWTTLRSRLRHLGLGLALVAAGPAFAGDDEPAGEEDLSLTGASLPKLQLPAEDAEPRSANVDYQIDPDMTIAEYAARPYGPMTYHGAQALKLDPEFVHLVQQGLELLYLRKYTEAREHFANVEKTFPGTAVAAVADTLVWQALMLENFDFKYDKQYAVSSKAAKEGLQAALAQPGGEAWEHVLMGGIVGIEAIYAMRKMQLLSALQQALAAMDHIGRAREAAPDFLDLALADGMYNYWRSVVTMSSDLLPDFEDRRLEGIEQMTKVQASGVFLSPLASLALAFTWMEEGEHKRALDACLRNRKAYPDNIVNNLVTGTTYITMKRYPAALEVFDHVLRVDPKNKRVRYWRGVAYAKNDQLAEAETELKQYLTFDALEKYQVANAQYRLAQVYDRQKRYAEAFEAYKLAEKADGHKGAKAAIDRMKKRRSEGKIDF